MSDLDERDFVKNIRTILWQNWGVLRVDAIMWTPDWFVSNVNSGWINSNISGEVSVVFYIYPGLSYFYEKNLRELLNLCWEGGLRPACFRPFCCCEYEASGFPGYENGVSTISLSPLTDMDSYCSGAIEIEVFEDYRQQVYIEDIRKISEYFGASVNEVFEENGVERWRQCKTLFCHILFEGERYQVTFDHEARRDEVKKMPDKGT
jgi:hypothetical protein